MHIKVVSNLPSDISYYYIDNVIVEKLSTTLINSLHNISTEMNLYPNPFTNHSTLIFNNQDQQSFTLIIYNTQGQAVQHIENITSDRISIERNGLPSGFYYYQLRNTNNIVANGKFIIN